MPAKFVPAQSSQLRDEAETRLAQITPDRSSTRSAQEILHELHVHQIELEMQNDALRLAQIALEKSRDRYVDLYEFAPVSYITLTTSGQIADINLRGATLLGEDREKLHNRRFERFVLAEDQPKWRRYFCRALENGGQKVCELRMQRRNGAPFNGCLSSSLTNDSDGVPELRIALTDITAQTQAEEECRQFESRLRGLTKREREVLVLALSGKLNKDIAVRLGVGQRTVENHRANIHRKTGVISLLELAQQAAAAGVTVDSITPIR
jgi:PAS domain S-box-containing protein